MTLRALSASQAERFDPEQVGGCKRRWYFQDVMRLKVPQSDAARNDGDAGHVHFAHYYRTGDRPRRAKMAKAVNGALHAGHLPARELGQLIESRFDGQPARDAKGERVPLDVTRTLWLGGVPWDGYVDLRFYRAGMITVLDHKFSSDIHAYAKTDLMATVQMPVYALDSLRLWPEAQLVELVHHYVSRRGVDSFLRRQLVTVEQVRQRGRQIEALVQEMLAVSQATSPDDVPGNRKSCHTWSGCPFQSRCTAFKEKPKMDLNPEELEWLNVVGGGEGADRGVTPMTLGELAVAEAAGRIDDARGKASVDGTEEGSRHAAELDPSTPGTTLTIDDDPFAVFAPVPSTPQEQPALPPSCPDCSTELNAENGSQKDGRWTHIRCPARGATPAATGAKCPDCPHPVHTGTACGQKRGRGACRCGAQGVVEKAQDAAALVGGHLTTCVQNDAGKWLCMEGCTASVGGGDGVTLTTANSGKAPGVLNAPETQRWSGTEPNPPGNLHRGILTPDLERQKLTDDLEREQKMHRRTLGELEASERERNKMEEELETLRAATSGAPTPMLLWCPACHTRHIDEGEFAEKFHHTHACQSCGLAWRPAVVATVGVRFLPGFKND